jgi:hypothetical protein
MILPVTDEIVQRYLEPQQLQRLRTHTSTSPTNKKISERNISVNQIVHFSLNKMIICIFLQTRKSINKSTMTLNHSEVEQPIQNIQK